MSDTSVEAQLLLSNYGGAPVIFVADFNELGSADDVKLLVRVCDFKKLCGFFSRASLFLLFTPQLAASCAAIVSLRVVTWPPEAASVS